MSDHAAELRPFLKEFGETLRKASLAFLGNPICGTCATDIYLKVLAGAMVTSYQGMCDALQIQPEPGMVIQYIVDVWNEKRETLQ